MAREWDWERVNWEGFSEALRDIRSDLTEAEGHINELAGDDAISDDVHEALSKITSALTGLTFVVNMHHQHVTELEAGGPTSTES